MLWFINNPVEIVGHLYSRAVTLIRILVIMSIVVPITFWITNKVRPHDPIDNWFQQIRSEFDLANKSDVSHVADNQITSKKSDLKIEQMRRKLIHLSEVLKKHPYTNLASDECPHFYADMRVGHDLLSDVQIASVLDFMLGIKQDSFFGTGLASPRGSKTYSDARVHEYLVHNMPTENSSIWMWKLSPTAGTRDFRIKKLIETKIDNANTINLKDDWLRYESGGTQGVNHTLFIRFAKLSIAKYEDPEQGLLVGHHGAEFVFFSDLADVWNLTIAEAAELSGYSFDTKPDADAAIYIWIFKPTDTSEVIPATWENVLKLIGSVDNPPSVLTTTPAATDPMTLHSTH